MQNAFRSQKQFNADLSRWNTSNVTFMYNMFNGPTNLTSVELADTGQVTDMDYMFRGATSLTSIHLPNTG